MKRQIDPKYAMEIVDHGQCEPPGIRIVNLAGVPVPDDEPLILFRARDRNALDMLRFYRAICRTDGCTDFHLRGIDNRIEAFEQFAISQPGRMKQPGITEGK